jgi:hypothetical protein
MLFRKSKNITYFYEQIASVLDIGCLTICAREYSVRSAVWEESGTEQRYI